MQPNQALDMDFYICLPANMAQEEIESMVSELLLNSAQLPPHHVGEALTELIERQLYNYQPFTSNTRQGLIGWIAAVWRDEDAALVDLLLTMLVNIPCPEGEHFLTEKRQGAPPKLAQLIDQALGELPKH